MKKKKKCYIYIRVSTAMQVDGYSLEAQKERLTKFAAFQEMEVVREYCDAGKSGKSITGRPEFTKMLQDIAENGEDIDFILVFKLSRFGRNAADVLNSLRYIQDYGVNLICLEDGIDSSKDSGKLTITVLSAVAEIERENILVQTMEGRKQKAREGKWNGGQAPFGYTLDTKNSTLIVNPEEAELVRLIFDKFVHTDMGADTICGYLNQHGYTKKRVRDQEVSHFTRSFLMRVLDNPVYTGKIAYGKSATEKVKGSRDEYKRVKTDEYLLADGMHDAIIDEETWEAARQKRKRTSQRWVKTHSLEHEHILSGIIKCPLCGAWMTGTVYRRHNKKTDEYKDTFYYRCHHRKRADGKLCDFAPKLNQDIFNSEVEDVIRYMVREGRFREYMKNKLDEQVDVSYLEDEKKQLQGQLQQV
ncbi:MAG: recombinase family protein [Bacteroidales bacterium]|nr:recombinase family protein [Bacteroidales bacterium]